MCQDLGSIFSLNLVKQPLAEIQTRLLDICPVIGFFFYDVSRESRTGVLSCPLSQIIRIWHLRGFLL